MAYFPMFTDLKEKICLVVGGGHVALRKIKILLDFEADVHVIAQDPCEEIIKLAKEGQIKLKARRFEFDDLMGMSLVIAATDDHAVNHDIAENCKTIFIPVNAVDQKEDCSFIMPAYVKQGDVVAAFSSGGSSPVLVQYLKECEKQILTPELGQIAEGMGAIRPKVKSAFATEAGRKEAFKAVFERALKQKAMPSDEEIEELLAALK